MAGVINNETQERYLKKLNTATIWTLVLSIIMALFTLFGAVSVITANIEEKKEELKKAAELVKQVGFKVPDVERTYGVPAKIFSGAGAIAIIIAVILIILAFRKIGSKEIPSKVGYYFYLLGLVIPCLQVLFVNGFGLLFILQLAFYLVLAIPVFLGLSYFSKIEGK